MRVFRRGLFCRIVVDKTTMSKKKFLRRKAAFKYCVKHQDKNGFPTVERRGKWLK